MNKRTAAKAWLAMSVAVVVLLGMAPTVPGPGDPLVGAYYALEAGSVMGYFTEIDGIGSENEVVEYKVVTKTGQEIVQKIPGRLKFLDVSLKRGITANMNLWAWRAQVEAGNMTARKNASISLMDQMATEIARWELIDAWPSKVVQSNASATAGSTAIEELILVNEGYTRVK